MNHTQVSRVFICTGHTGGHFFPAVSFAEALTLEHPDVEIHVLMTKMSPFSQVYAQSSRFKFHLIPFSSFRSFFSFKMILFLIEYARAFQKTFLLFLKSRPKVIVGFGSYGSVLGVLIAKLFGVTVILHEQNATAGKANRFLAKFAKRVAISFPETQGFPDKKTFWTGFPLRTAFWRSINSAAEATSNSKPFTILILGGSQGASRLNEVIVQFFRSLGGEERANLAVIHITGQNDFELVKHAYPSLNIYAQVFDFSHKIVEHYKQADLVISRAGAGTVFELAALGKAAILVPYPYAYNHQKENAMALVKRDSAWMIEEKDLSYATLSEAVFTIYRNQERKQLFEKNIKQFANREASQILAANTWSLICKKN